MEFVPDLVLAFLVVGMGWLITRSTGELRQELRGEIKDLRNEMSELRGEVRTEIRGLRTEMSERFRDQGNEIAALRGDVTQIALALAGQPRRQ